MVKQVVRQGRSELRDAMNKERPVCARRRDGEPALSRAEGATFFPAHPEPAETAPFAGGTLRT
jgi:hypothetical protein